ncbi:hypothetical protein DFH08DRAFT_60456 [Mycena albidolilacea]|uniref:Uncharacterized protein n=1 Tax=Mycena albidolilacea TaxID=1033008 RepID=A0AAD7AA12_9AGAR|nr:hypothetical protein DFH08DRAFT_60456 [Mycena albidolilacea]
MAGSLLSVSPEVLRDVVLHAIGTVGPPHAWYSLVLCCQTFRRQLDTPAMHALLFAKRFHVPADAYHLLPAHAKTELQRRFSALKFFKRGEQCLDDHESWVDALWLAYVMLRAEEPRQMNVDQLLWAGLPHLLLLFLKQRLNDGAEKNHGWPLANDTNSLAIALMWLLSSESSVRAESPATRDAVMERIRPYVLAAFRYPLALASLQGECCGSGSTILPLADITTSERVDEAYPAPLPPPSSREIAYFGPRTVHVPSAPVYSILCYFTRLDTLSPMFPVHLAAAGRVQVPSRAGPCREDVEHFINECRTRFEPWDFATETSIPRADDSLTRYLTQSYFPGSLTGRWQGSSIVPCLNNYKHWLNDAEAPENMDTFCRQPLYITLQEYVSCTEKPALSGRLETGQCVKRVDASLPTSWEERDGGIEVQYPSDGCKRFYPKAEGDSARPSTENVADVIVAGQTDDPYASAWGAFKIIGRVRLSDGLIVLRRESVAGLGTTVLRGYMSSPRNFVGRYRAIHKGCEAAEWEAAFSLCKME